MSNDFFSVLIYCVAAVVITISSYCAGKKTAYREVIAMHQQELQK